jgi:hypothetical protein
MGWFSVGLGLMELIAPKRMARQFGLRGRHGMVRSFGLREIASGALILLDDGRNSKWMWLRVAGDLMDLGLLESAHPYSRGRRRNLLAAKAAVLGATAMDVVGARQVQRDQRWAY